MPLDRGAIAVGLVAVHHPHLRLKRQMADQVVRYVEAGDHASILPLLGDVIGLPK